MVNAVMSGGSRLATVVDLARRVPGPLAHGARLRPVIRAAV